MKNSQSQTLSTRSKHSKPKIVRKNPIKKSFKIVKRDEPLKNENTSAFIDTLKKYGNDIKVGNKPISSIKPKSNEEHVHYTNEWVNVKDVRGGLICTHDGRYLKILEIKPINYWQMSMQKKEAIIHDFTTLSLASPTKFMLKMVTDTVDINSVINHVKDVNSNRSNPNIKHAEKDYIEHSESLKDFAGLETRYYYIFEYEKQSDEGMKNDFETIWNSMQTIEAGVRDTFQMCGNEVVTHDLNEENKFQLETLFKYFCKNKSKEISFDDNTDRLDYDSEMYSRKIGKHKEYEISDFISPWGIDTTHPDLLCMDGMYYAYLTIKDNGYPNYLAGGWLDRFIQGRGIDVTVSCKKQPASLVEAFLSRKKGWDKDRLSSRFMNADKERLIRQSINNNEQISYHLELQEDVIKTVTTFTFWGKNPKEIFKRRNEVARKLKKSGIHTERAKYDLDQYMANTSPLLTYSNPIFFRNGHDMLSSSLATMYNFTRYSTFDYTGVIIGRSANSIAALNNFNTKLYKNAHMNVYGSPGAGKTFFLQLFGRRSFLTGTNVYMMLPVKAYEWEKGVRALDGVFARLTPGSDTCLNIMEIFPDKELTEDADEDQFEYSKQSLLTRKITSLITWIELRNGKEITNANRSLLSTLLTEIYADYGITNDNMSIYNSDGTKKIFPTLKTWYDKAAEKPEQFKYINELLYVFIHGQYKNFVGQTNFDTSNPCIAFDINEREVDEHDLPSIMYIAFDFCINKCISNKGFTNIIGDEFWKALQTESCAKQVQMMSKVLRGYGGALITATQEINDLAENKYGRSVLNNAKINIVLNVEENEFKMTQNLINVSNEDYINHISKFKRGQCLFIANGIRVPIQIMASDEEYNLFTTDKNDKINKKRA